MKITTTELENMDKIKKLNLINSLTGFKPANLVATKSDRGISNVAIISSVTHLSSSPAYIGFNQRPLTVTRHTYNNIKENGYFTINHVHSGILSEAHYTSAKFDEDISEFNETGLTEEYMDGFYAPFVKESFLKFSVSFEDEYHIKESNTILIVGKILSIYLPDDMISRDGQLDLSKYNSVAVSGLNNYHSAPKLAAFPYARPGRFPDNEFTG